MQNERPNQRKLAFRQEAINALVELKDLSELTDEKILEVAKLDCQQCKLHDTAHNPKSSNCRDNPFCIYRLGIEKFDKLITKELNNREIAKKEQKRRDLNDEPAGLINQGNFCYVNSFLQVWFNEPEFRQIIYDFRPSSDYTPPEWPKMNLQSVMLSLQEIFYTLETTPFFDTDKNTLLIKSLRLNHEQQDSQEFTIKLFDALDRNLPSHPNGKEMAQRLKDLVMGETCQTITCECGMVSKTHEKSMTLQLNIDGHHTLQDALDANFRAEKLDDYKCVACRNQGNVKRETTYVKLPPVVIIQLNRYKYTSKGREKLKTNLSYSRELSVNTFLRNQTNSDDIYDLFAVTIHEGENAQCGHYYDLIKSPTNHKWFMYNDEKVEQIKSLPGTEKPLSGRTTKKKPTGDQKGCYGLLYRRRNGFSSKPTSIKHPPDKLVMASKKDLDEQFEGATKTNVERTERRLYDVQRRYEKLKNVESKLETFEGKFENANSVAFVPVSLLTNVFQQEYEVAKVKEDCKPKANNNKDKDVEKSSDVDILELAVTSSDLPIPLNDTHTRTRAQNGITKSVFGYTRRNSAPAKVPISTRVAARLDSHEMSLCRHGKLSIDLILYGDVKAVSRAPVISFLREYDFKPKIVRDDGSKEYPLPEKDKEVFVLTAADICKQCVYIMRQEGMFLDRLEDDDRLVRKILKEEKIRCSVRGIEKKHESDLYIAKTALMNFKRMAIKEWTDIVEANETSNSGILVYESTSNQKDDPGFTSNMKRLRTRDRRDENVSPARKTSKYDSRASCDLAVIEFPDKILEDEESPTKSTNGCNDEEVPVEPNEPVETPVEKECELETNEFNNELRCPHGGINYSQFRHSVSPEEWQIISSYFKRSFAVGVNEPVCEQCRLLDVEAQKGSNNIRSLLKELRKTLGNIVKRISENTCTDSTSYGICSIFIESIKTRRQWSTTHPPKVCQACLICEHDRPYRGFASQMSKDDAHMVRVSETDWNDIIKEMSKFDALFTENPIRAIRIQEGEIEGMCVECNKTYLEMMELNRYTFDNQSIFVRVVSPFNSDDALKARRNKNVHSFKMSSSSKLIDLKVELFNKYHQSPNDQLLYLCEGGANLDKSSNNKTLFELRVLPNNADNPLILIADRSAAPPPNVEQLSEHDDQQPERGFVDTALAH